MKSFFLLILSLTTGCEARSEVKECREVWSEFVCTYRKINENDQMSIDNRDGRPNQKQPVKVLIKQDEDFWKHHCVQQSQTSSRTVELELEVENNRCKKKVTMYTGAKIPIPCGHSGNAYKSKFFCNKDYFICEDILSRSFSQKSGRRVTITETKPDFNVSISNESSRDHGVYWCGVASSVHEWQMSLTKIKLKVIDITVFRRSPTIGQNFTYWCSYEKISPNEFSSKFICKGQDPSTCQLLASTTKPGPKTRFSMNEDEKKNITITVREVTTNDSGTYWCGVDNQNSKQFIHKFILNVVSSVPSASPEPSTETATVPAQSHADRYEVIFAVISCVAVVLLLLLLLVAGLIFIYKRWSISTHTTNAAAKRHPKENNVYEEIQERLQNPNSEVAMNTIYTTANLPANPAASLHYSTIHFLRSPDKGGVLTPKPSSSACQYTTIKYTRCPTDSQPLGPTGEPLYSTVNKLRKQ